MLAFYQLARGPFFYVAHWFIYLSIPGLHYGERAPTPLLAGGPHDFQKRHWVHWFKDSHQYPPRLDFSLVQCLVINNIYQF